MPDFRNMVSLYRRVNGFLGYTVFGFTSEKTLLRKVGPGVPKE